MIRTEGITKSYGKLVVLHDVSLSVSKAEMVAITGPSGAGKTTLLQIIGSLDQADKGKVWINDTELSTLKGNQLAAFRNKHIGFVFQFHHLLPEFTALENICIPAYIARRGKSEAERDALQLLDMLNLKDRAQHKPAELSGGEAQRVAIARALINRPDVVLADEPSGNLDEANSNELHELFVRLRDELSQTFVIVTHDLSLAGKSDRIIKLKDGVIE
ncbi:MAG: ABC transporter ATP-binding protein, partial [Bacteroidales bacterium]|nr:ABC transporter ATP-binding protein [Bacteroidales bacterium]